MRRAGGQVRSSFLLSRLAQTLFSSTLAMAPRQRTSTSAAGPFERLDTAPSGMQRASRGPSAFAQMQATESNRLASTSGPRMEAGAAGDSCQPVGKKPKEWHGGGGAWRQNKVFGGRRLVRLRP